MLAMLLPASEDSPLSILPSSPLPITQAIIPRIKGQKIKEAIPQTKAIIALVLAPALADPEPVGGGGGAPTPVGGGGGAPKSCWNN